MNEQEILTYLQRKLSAKRLKQTLKPGTVKEKMAARPIDCTFCRERIMAGAAYVSFRPPEKVLVKGRPVRTERMHPNCLNRFSRV